MKPGFRPSGPAPELRFNLSTQQCRIGGDPCLRLALYMGSLQMYKLSDGIELYELARVSGELKESVIAQLGNSGSW